MYIFFFKFVEITDIMNAENVIFPVNILLDTLQSNISCNILIFLHEISLEIKMWRARQRIYLYTNAYGNCHRYYRYIFQPIYICVPTESIVQNIVGHIFCIQLELSKYCLPALYIADKPIKSRMGLFIMISVYQVSVKQFIS